MPTITLNKKVFEGLVGKKLPDDKLKDRISYLGTGLESIDDENIVVEIFPNRPDLLSEQGFARAFRTFIGVDAGLKKYKIKKSGPEDRVIVEESVRSVRPYTACAIVKNLHFDDEKIKEIIQIQEKLHVTYGRNRKKVAIGVYPFEKIKTPIRFTAKKPEDIKFQPLEFPREINGVQILSQHATGREYGHLLEGMDKFPIFIDANDKILSMPPIINSHDVGKISELTKDVFVECSGFDYHVLSKCLNMIVCALADMGGEIYSMEIDFYGKKELSPNLEPDKMKLDIDYVNRLLGLKLKEKDVKELLEKMGYSYTKGKVQVPAYRADVMHPIDLVEDISIAYGFENYKPEIPKVATIGEEAKIEVFKNKIVEMLVGLRLLEVKTYHLTNKDSQTKKMDQKLDLIELANALNADYNVLQRWMIPSLFGVLDANKHNEYPQNIFGVGKVFSKDKESKTETNIIEKEHLAVLLCNEETDFTRIKQIFDYIMINIDLSYASSQRKHPSFIEGRCASATIDGKEIAFFGEIAPEVISNWNLELPITALEIDLNALFEIFGSKNK